MDNAYYAKIFSEIASLLQIKGANRYKVRAYQNAARAVSGLSEPLEDVIARDAVLEISGVGEGLAADIAQIHERGSCQARTELLEQLDPGLLDLLKIQGMGAKRVKTLYDTLGISNLDALEAAAKAGEVQKLPGLGAKTEQKFLAEVERLRSAGGRTPLPAATALAASFRDAIAALDGVLRVEVAGSIRRQRETIGDIDLLAATDQDPAPFSNQPLGALWEHLAYLLREGIPGFYFYFFFIFFK